MADPRPLEELITLYLGGAQGWTTRVWRGRRRDDGVEVSRALILACATHPAPTVDANPEDFAALEAAAERALDRGDSLLVNLCIGRSVEVRFGLPSRVGSNAVIGYLVGSVSEPEAVDLATHRTLRRTIPPGHRLIVPVNIDASDRLAQFVDGAEGFAPEVQATLWSLLARPSLDVRIAHLEQLEWQRQVLAREAPAGSAAAARARNASRSTGSPSLPKWALAGLGLLGFLVTLAPIAFWYLTREQTDETLVDATRRGALHADLTKLRAGLAPITAPGSALWPAESAPPADWVKAKGWPLVDLVIQRDARPNPRDGAPLERLKPTLDHQALAMALKGPALSQDRRLGLAWLLCALDESEDRAPLLSISTGGFPVSVANTCQEVGSAEPQAQALITDLSAWVSQYGEALTAQEQERQAADRAWLWGELQELLKAGRQSKLMKTWMDAQADRLEDPAQAPSWVDADRYWPIVRAAVVGRGLVTPKKLTELNAALFELAFAPRQHNVGLSERDREGLAWIFCTLALDAATATPTLTLEGQQRPFVSGAVDCPAGSQEAARELIDAITEEAAKAPAGSSRPDAQRAGQTSASQAVQEQGGANGGATGAEATPQTDPPGGSGG